MNDETTRELIALTVAAIAGDDALARSALADKCLENGMEKEADALRSARPGWIVEVRERYRQSERLLLYAPNETEARRIAAATVMDRYRMAYAEMFNRSADIIDTWIRLCHLYEQEHWDRILLEAVAWQVEIVRETRRPPEPPAVS